MVSTAAAARDETELRVFKAEADTYISAAAPDRNFGFAPRLRVDGSPESTVYVRFRMKRLKGAEIESVTLLLHARTGARTRYQVRPVREDDWKESRLTYSNAPRLSLRYAFSKPVRRGAWSAVDVTPFSRSGDGRVNLAITTRSPTGVVFASRESDRGPRLVVRTVEHE